MSVALLFVVFLVFILMVDRSQRGGQNCVFMSNYIADQAEFKRNKEPEKFYKQLQGGECPICGEELNIIPSDSGMEFMCEYCHFCEPPE